MELSEGRRWVEAQALDGARSWPEELSEGRRWFAARRGWLAQGCRPRELEDPEQLMSEAVWVHVRLCEVRWILLRARCRQAC